MSEKYDPTFGSDARALSSYVCVSADGLSAQVQRTLNQTLWAFLAVGTLLTIINLRWPLARNALDYAKAALVILQRHFDLFAVVREEDWTGGKPILFSALAAPFIGLTNATIGTLIGSGLGTAFFLYTVALALPRLNKCAGLNPNLAPLELIFTAFNPLVLYQFWSGYPDALFAGFVILAFVLIDIIAVEPERDTRRHIVALGVTLCAAIYTKLYGAVLVIICPLYLLINARQFSRRTSHRGSKLLLFAVMLAVVASILISAKLQLNPLLKLGSGSGFNGYVTGLTWNDLKWSLTMLAVTVLLVFHIALLFLLSPRVIGRWPLSPTFFIASFTVGLLLFPGTAYNMRYLLPLLPFIAPLLAQGCSTALPTVRNTLLSAYGILALTLVLTYNVVAVERVFEPLIGRLNVWQPYLVDWLDNLRLPAQVAMRAQIDAVNNRVPQGSTLYWSSDYYGAATHGLAHDLGVRKSLDVRYVLEPSDVPVSKSPVFLTLFTSFAPPEEFWGLASWATSKSLGQGLFRLDPIAVSLRSLGGDHVPQNDPIRLDISVASAAGITVRNEALIEGDQAREINSAQQAELTISNATPGRHEYFARVTYGEGEITASTPIVVYVGVPAMERWANLPGDLLDEYSDGSPIIPKDMLFLNEAERAVGMRFENIAVPHGSHVVAAYLQLTAASRALAPMSMDVRAERSVNAADLTPTMNVISVRPPTVSSVTWRLGQWTQVGDRERSPNLARVLEEVFTQPQWQPGGAVLLIFRVSGDGRLVKATGPAEAPSLYIQMR